MSFPTWYIYSLTNSVDDTIYIGCTVECISTRFKYHTGELLYKYRSNTRTSKLYLHLDKIGWNNVSINLLETVNCESYRHLHIYETKYMIPYLGKPNCLNMAPSFSYYNYHISKCTMINSSADFIYHRLQHFRKLYPVLNEYMRVIKLCPTDFIYSRAKYDLEQVHEELCSLIKPISALYEAEGTCLDTNPIIPLKKRGQPKKEATNDPPQPKKRGRPKKEKPIEPPKIPKKRGRPKKEPSEPVPDMQTSHEPSITPPNNAPSEPVITAKPRPKFSKKMAKINTNSIIPLSSFGPSL
jgi:hypothetical protein